MMPTPEAFSLAIRSNRLAASDSVSEAVGSSRIRQPDVGEQRLDDLDHLLMRARQAPHLAVGMEVEPEFGDDGFSARARIAGPS